VLLRRGMGVGLRTEEDEGEDEVCDTSLSKINVLSDDIRGPGIPCVACETKLVYLLS
jgi:hypothetical protein